MALPAMKYASRYKIPFLLNCCDLWPESIKMYIKDERSILYRISDQISRKAYKSANRILVQSKGFIGYLNKTHGIIYDKMKFVPAFADESYLSYDFTPEDDTVDFVYLGNLGIAQDLMSVLKAIKQIKDLPGFKVHFVGDGVLMVAMQEYVRNEKMEGIVLFHGRKPQSEMPRYYKIADACLASLTGDNATGLSFPQKIQGYMAAGKPVFAMMDGQVRGIIEEAGCGACVPAGDADALADTMKDFILHREKYEACGENARMYFKEHFTKRKFMDLIEKEMDALIGSGTFQCDCDNAGEIS